MTEEKYSSSRLTDRVKLQEVVPLKMPFAINLEICRVCNFSCSFCEHALKKPVKDKYLSWDNFIHIVTELKNLSVNVGEKYKLFEIVGVGESLLHPRVIDMINYIKKLDIAQRIEMPTNASKLTNKMSLDLIDAGLSKLTISVEGISKENYKKTCGYDIDFEQFVDNIKFFYENSRGKCHVHIKILDVAIEEKDKEKFYQIFSPMCDTIDIEHAQPFFENIEYNNLSFEHRYNDSVQEILVCNLLFFYFKILIDGDVNVCCGNKRLIFGNILKNHIDEIWNGKEHKSYMKMHLEGLRNTIQVCNDCAALKYQSNPADNLDNYRNEILKRVELLGSKYEH